MALRTYASRVLLFSIVGSLVAVAQSASPLERTMFIEYHQPMAAWLAGNAPPPATPGYPARGLAVLLATLGSVSVLRVVQILIGALALAAMREALVARSPANQRTIDIVLVLAVPWYAMITTYTPGAIAISCVLLAALCFARAHTSSALRWPLLAAATCSVLVHFRSEWLAFPAFAFVVLTLARRLGAQWARPRIAAYTLLAVLCSWAPWSYAVSGTTGERVITPTNSGWVSYITLGQLPRNPWGIRHTDALAFEIVHEELGADVHPASIEGNRFLRKKAWEAIQAEPLAYTAKLAWNFTLAIGTGYYAGDWAWREEHNEQRAIAGEQLSMLARGQLPRDFEWAAAVRLLCGRAAGLVLGLVFNLLAVFGMATAYRRRDADAWLWVLSIFWVFQLLICAAMQSQPRHMSTVFILMVPWAARGWTELRGMLARRYAAARAR